MLKGAKAHGFVFYCENIKMALTQSKRFYLHLSKRGKRDLFPVLFQGNNFQNFLSVVHYCEKPEPSAPVSSTLSKAMRLHLEKAEKYDKFMKEQFAEYELGKKFLANMMGKNVEKMTEKEIDEAIEYLFPSALYVPKSRPLMKPPDVIYAKQKEAVFDFTGRPFHFLFYTCRPHFSQLLHDAATQLEKLNKMSHMRSFTPKPLSLLGGRWFSKAELETLFMEKLYDIEYEKFLVLFERLLKHPYALTAENFIKQYWKVEIESIEMNVPKPVSEENDVKVYKIEGLRKKSTAGDVTLIYPGTGKFKINNLGLDYFQEIERRQQVIYPLVLTEMLGKVDVIATVQEGGESSQAAAIRLGISTNLTALVPEEMILKMKLAGLLQKDYRRRERKKPGQEGSRRKYTWLKR